jgi:hypothetical protein
MMVFLGNNDGELRLPLLVKELACLHDKKVDEITISNGG